MWSHHACWLLHMVLQAYLPSHYPCQCTRYASGPPMQSLTIHTVCQCTIQASWLFAARWCPTIPAGFLTWLCKLTCYPTTHAGALGMPVQHLCSPQLFIPYASAQSKPVGFFLHAGDSPHLPASPHGSASSPAIPLPMPVH